MPWDCRQDSWASPGLCLAPTSPPPSPVELQKNVPPCHHFFPSCNVLSMGQAGTCSLPRACLAGGGRPRTHHSWKSDLYLKNKKSNKPQMICNKPLVMSCPNTCAVSLLTCAGAAGGGTPGSPSGLAATSPAAVPAGNVTPDRGHGPQQALLWVRAFQPPLPPAPAGRGCPSQGVGERGWSPWEPPLPGRGWPGASIPRREPLGCGRGARSCGVAPVGNKTNPNKTK